MTRFMTPRYFTQTQQAAVEQAVRQLNLVDEEGLRIFIIALEYELAEYEKLAGTTAPTVAPQAVVNEQPLAALQTLTRELDRVILQLKQLPEQAQQQLLTQLSAEDRFARPHTKSYLDAMVIELSRISTVCAQLQEGVAERTGLSATESHFISMVAEAYFECFELHPRENDGEPFATLLQRILEICGLKIALSSAVLQPILSKIG